jgi:23S rRNA pseudouridine1911/1915/1917 synthase
MDRPLLLPSESPEPTVLFIAEEEEGIRLDRLLADRYPRYSRTYFQALIEAGYVLLNGQTVKKRFLPEEGDEIEVCFPLTPESALEPELIPLEIIYEDEYFLAVNKAAGMVVHPAPGHRSGTFVNALLGYCKQISSLDPLRPGIVHRLDKDTSGILLAAKTVEAHQKFIEKFSNREMEKLYLAICVGRPKTGLLSAPISRHPVHRKEMAILPDGKEAITEIQVAAFNDKLSLASLRPKTGRTHQIRVHLKHLGAPILGDSVYGIERINHSLGVSRQLLHAYRLTFIHPITNAEISLSAPLPEDMKYWMNQLCSPSLSQQLV